MKSGSRATERAGADRQQGVAITPDAVERGSGSRKTKPATFSAGGCSTSRLIRSSQVTIPSGCGPWLDHRSDVAAGGAQFSQNAVGRLVRCDLDDAALEVLDHAIVLRVHRARYRRLDQAGDFALPPSVTGQRSIFVSRLRASNSLARRLRGNASRTLSIGTMTSRRRDRAEIDDVVNHLPLGLVERAGPLALDGQIFEILARDEKLLLLRRTLAAKSSRARPLRRRNATA